MTVTIVQLFPDELGVAGDRGNVLALRARLTLSGIESTLVEHRRGDVLPESADCVLVGGGPLSAMRTVREDLDSAAERLRGWADAGVPFFAYGSGAELLGRRVTLVDGSELPGLGILPFRATRVTERTVGYVLTETEWGPLVGFEDNASTWTLDEGATPLGTVTTGGGNGDGTEGVRSGSSIGTQVGGPVLPLNPLLTDVLVAAIAARRSIPLTTTAPTPIDDYAERARAVIVAHASHVFSRI